VIAPFTDAARLDLERLDGLARVAVRMMDNAIDVSRLPLEAAWRTRRAPSAASGSASPGLADALIQCRVRYGSTEALALTEQWMAALRRAAYLASTRARRREGCVPAI